MKPFSGGQLLEGRTSPFGMALSQYQCIQYALDKPGVLTVLPGIRNVEDVKNFWAFSRRMPRSVTILSLAPLRRKMQQVHVYTVTIVSHALSD